MKTSSRKALRTMLMVCWSFLCLCYNRRNETEVYLPFNIANSYNLMLTLYLSGLTREKICITLEIQSVLWLSHVVVLWPVSLKVRRAAIDREVISAMVIPAWWSVSWYIGISSLVLWVLLEPLCVACPRSTLPLLLYGS